MRIASRAASAAFTLIELVIGAAVASIILISAYACLRAGVDGRNLIETRADIAQTARVALALMASDLRAACPLSQDFEFLGMQRMMGEVEADNIDFATHHYTPRRPSEGDWCEVSYFIDKNPATGTYSLWRRRDPAFGSDPLSGGTREEIAEGVRGLRFEYYDGLDWYETWGAVESNARLQTSALPPPNLSGFPDAVRITLWLLADSKPTGAAREDETEAPPPRIGFQTVVRLNLARSATPITPPAGTGGSSGAEGAAGPRTGGGS